MKRPLPRLYPQIHRRHKPTGGATAPFTPFATCAALPISAKGNFRNPHSGIPLRSGSPGFRKAA